MATIPCHSLTSLDGIATDGTWDVMAAQRNSVLDMSNPKCPRHIILDSSGVIITRPGEVPVHLSMALLLKAALKVNPKLDVPATEPGKKAAGLIVAPETPTTPVEEKPGA